jgi:hypothetical protein
MSNFYGAIGFPGSGLSPDLSLTTFGSNITDRGEAPAVDDRRVANSGSRLVTATSNDSPVPSVDKSSLVYRLQKLNGMEKKRRSRTRRDQPAADKPGQPYPKSAPHTQTNSPTAQSTSPGPSSRLPPRRKDDPGVSRIGVSSSYFNPFSTSTSHKYRAPSTTSPFRSSPSPSLYYPSTSTSSPSPGSRNLSPFQGTLPIPTPTSDHLQHMALTTRSAPDSLSLSSPGHPGLQNYSHGITGDFASWDTVSQIIPIDGLRPATIPSNDIYGHRLYRNEYDRPQGRFESIYPTAATSLFSPVSYGLGTVATEYPSGNYLYSGYEDRAAGTSLQNIYPLTDHSSNAGSSTTLRM